MTGDLLTLLPPLSRARDFRLYAEGGRRLVDLWQYGGGALLGHKPPAVLRELKNTAERGLFVPLPHLRENRLVKALAKFFPGAVIRLYADEASLRRALAKAGVSGAGDPFLDPALAGVGDGERGLSPGGLGGPALSLWRPFLPEEPAAPFLIPILPWPLAPQVLIIREKATNGEDFGGDRISPVILAATVRAVYDLGAAKARGELNFPRIKKALNKSPWRRRGIYLSLAESAEAGDYEQLFRRFFDAGFLLPPGPESPLILPGVLSAGEEAKLAVLLRE